MKQHLLVGLLVLGLGCAWTGPGLAGDIGYRFREEKPGLTRVPGPPSSVAVATDALLGRPLGLATTIAGAGVFLVTLPFSASAGNADEAAWGLVGRPGAWTFVRPMGRGEPKFEEQGIFRP
jgi:hypothetical protein